MVYDNLSYELCKIIIEDGIENNPFMTSESMEEQITILKSGEGITEEQAIELIKLMNPVIEEPII